MSIKLVAIDVDATLLNSRNELTKHTIDTLKEAIAMGTKIVITSGRPLPGTEPYYAKLGIDKKDDQYAINYNGATIRTTSGRMISEATLTIKDYKDIYSLANKIGVKIQAETADCIYTPYLSAPKYTKYEQKLTNAKIRHVRMQDLKKSDVIAKIMFIDEPEIISRVKKELPAWVYDRFNVVPSSPVYIEFIDKKVSKGNAVRTLAEKLGIDISQVMAIGDQGNDLSMIEAVGVGVAMGNGIDDLKSIAQFVTKSNDEDGVAYAVEKFLLNK
ncbi:Cof-type HAD-IIB family hydrolase [Oenococcus oeni]|uniref:Cof-type HAD-IIB family hydrolase n=1 Tax=Oenococcus oeni TaxID=1247 RepID=UPI000277B2B6|nr:Cof-type HAD-IIB family hydrolase [Oenococcus oeni]AWW98483.1 Cof-type HAD-IIB family hydrolase [Oenococcus oeni]EJO01095.1 HAD superfamily hydrolase [Oenococcus oeni AWRIB419]EKP88899.1 HAD superfamily hydrolase [Oenococcus oeni DSM 20252 = AWRIB129]KEK03068.1 haloacid dehalogenase [Oenococcus oeni]KER93295.1 haloacid dehalogenase [Oenococcus oeni]